MMDNSGEGVCSLTDEDVEIRREYYSHPFVSLEIVKYSANREMAFLMPAYRRGGNIRYLNCGFLDMFYKHLGIQTREERTQGILPEDPWHFFSDNTKNYSIYTSLASIDWDKSPVKAMSFSSKVRKEEQSVFRDNIDSVISDFTGGIDFDGDLDYVWEYDKDKKKNVEKKVEVDVTPEEAAQRALTDAKIAIKEVFNRYSIPFWIQYSGSRGVHGFYTIPLDITPKQKCELASRIQEKIATVLNLKTIDRAELHMRKVFKACYSVVTNKGKTRVVLPLDDKQLDNFKLEDVGFKSVYNHIKVKDRGVLWRNTSIPKDERIEKFKEFLSDFEVNDGIQKKQ